MIVKTAYWFRYVNEGGFNHVAVVADTLEEAFDKISNTFGVDPLNIEYRNRSFDVIID